MSDKIDKNKELTKKTDLLVLVLNKTVLIINEYLLDTAQMKDKTDKTWPLLIQHYTAYVVNLGNLIGLSHTLNYLRKKINRINKKDSTKAAEYKKKKFTNFIQIIQDFIQHISIIVTDLDYFAKQYDFLNEKLPVSSKKIHTFKEILKIINEIKLEIEKKHLPEITLGSADNIDKLDCETCKKHNSDNIDILENIVTNEVDDFEVVGDFEIIGKEFDKIGGCDTCDKVEKDLERDLERDLEKVETVGKFDNPNDIEIPAGGDEVCRIIKIGGYEGNKEDIYIGGFRANKYLSDKKIALKTLTDDYNSYSAFPLSSKSKNLESNEYIENVFIPAMAKILDCPNNIICSTLQKELNKNAENLFQDLSYKSQIDYNYIKQKEAFSIDNNYVGSGEKSVSLTKRTNISNKRLVKNVKDDFKKLKEIKTQKQAIESYNDWLKTINEYNNPKLNKIKDTLKNIANPDIPVHIFTSFEIPNHITTKTIPVILQLTNTLIDAENNFLPALQKQESLYDDMADNLKDYANNPIDITLILRVLFYGIILLEIIDRRMPEEINLRNDLLLTLEKLAKQHNLSVEDLKIYNNGLDTQKILSILSKNTLNTYI